jgi:glycosyltransferase involved in cell wall biosynthesis
MRILFMTDTPENPHSGAAGTEYQTIAALRGLGHEVEAIWSDRLGRRIAHGNLHYLFELPVRYRDCMLEQLRQRFFDVVHVSQPHGFLAAKAARRMKNAPVFVHRSHGLEPRAEATLARWREPRRGVSPRSMASAMMAKGLARHDKHIAHYAHGHIVSSSLCSDYLHVQLGVPRDKIAVIAQAAPSAYVISPPVEWSPSRLNRILHVGQFALFKAPAVLTEAFEQIVAANPLATLTWVCANAHHEHARSMLSPAARARVRLLDWMPQEELMSVYDEHGIFLFPSYFEGFGKAFIEAMTRGLTVVASTEGGAKDLIESGRNGQLVPVGDAAAMARSCIDLQQGRIDAELMSRLARSTGQAHTWGRVGAETVTFYRRLIGSR